jgi:hypothetical protein
MKRMFSPKCGAQVGEKDVFCSRCGESLSQNGRRENVLDSFGPFGVSVCFGRPGFLVKAWKNNTKIFVTDRRVYGVGSGIFGGGSLRFQVPYDAVLSTESFAYGLQKAVWIEYQEAEKTKEVSVLSGSHSNSINSLYNQLQKTRPASTAR